MAWRSSSSGEEDQFLEIQAARSSCTIMFVKEPGPEVAWAKQVSAFERVRGKAGRHPVSLPLDAFE